MTHIAISEETKKILEQIKSSTGQTIVYITERALRHGMKMLYKNIYKESNK